jgi:hypothetical protein
MNSWPTNDQEIQEHKYIQELLISHLTGVQLEDYALNPIDENQLKQIANSESNNATYANGILMRYTDEILPLQIIDRSQNSGKWKWEIPIPIALSTNPSNGQGAKFLWDDDLSASTILEIYDINGTVLYQFANNTLSTDHFMELPILSDGMYIVLLRDGEMVLGNAKFLIQN